MDYNELHKKRLRKYLKAINRAFEVLIDSVASLYLKVRFKADLFEFRNFPNQLKDLEILLTAYHDEIVKIISTGISYEWNMANQKNDIIKRETLERIEKKIGKDLFNDLANKPNPQNLKALESFQNRKLGKFNVSERVWDITEGAKANLEMALDLALAEGKSANQLAREIRSNLKYPDKLFRRVRDKHGKLQLSKNAESFHPGQGVYRNSNKNALRLAANEINIAYKEADLKRISQNRDIVGYEVYLSPNHSVVDQCDILVGKYPKDFKFIGFHVSCKCGIKTILKTDDELINEINAGITTDESVNRVKDVSPEFKKWVKENEPKMENWKRKPDFINDNKKYL